MIQRISWVFLLVGFLTTGLFAEPVHVCPANPHYYCMNGHPVLLITSAEHYGSVINGDFDYVPYLDKLKAYGLNYTRIYPGAMFETYDKWIAGNPLGPTSEGLVAPWARSDVSGYMLGGNKFDLDQWNPKYFARLKDFIAKAGERGIVVEICFFNSQYSDTWPISPLYHQNNVQGVGKNSWLDAQTLKSPDLVRRESEYVAKITQEVNPFDNVILEICDECASVGTGAVLTGPWVSHMVDVVKNTERGLPKKHLLAQEVEGIFGGPMDFSLDPRVQIIVAQYLWGADYNELKGEMGGLRALDSKYSLNKPIEMNETDWYPLWYSGDKIADSRVEAWEFVVGGGAGFNQLNGLYTPEDPAGNSPDNVRILGALRSLKGFMNSFEFTRMSPDRNFVVGGIPMGMIYRCLSEPGKQYACYIHHSQLVRGGASYMVTPGDYKETLVLNLPRGNYQADWVNPSDGSIVASEKFEHKGGFYRLSTPQYSVDIALRIRLTQ
ncbi:MAG: hypothetical protein WCE63_23805 [Acidobacteriaceae bacterium]